MLLQRLVDYRPSASDEHAGAPRPYSRQRIVRWELNISLDGQLQGIVDLADRSQHSTRFGRPIVVPNGARTSGIAPCMGADDIQYVLGWVDDKTKPQRVAAAHDAFIAVCRRWYDRDPDEPVAAALAAFYARGGLARAPASMGPWTSKDLMVLVVNGQPAIDIDSLWTLWQNIVEERKSGTGDNSRRGVCLVCGRNAALLDRMPQALPKALIPRAEQEIALVSGNKRIHTYDGVEGLHSAPICVACGQAAVANLHTILTTDGHTFSYPGQRTLLTWWVTHGADSHTIALLDAEPTAIADYLEQIHTGRPIRPPGPHTLCSMSLSGNVARLVIHDWLEMPLTAAEDNVESWFADHQITPGWREEPVGFPIWLLSLVAGQWLPGPDGRSGRYIPLADKAADRPDGLAQLLLHAALWSTRLPPHVLTHLMRRIRTDRHLDAPRAALLRLGLLRHPHRHGQGPTTVLDDTQDTPAYLYGRLFSLLESLQLRAYRDAERPNVTFFDRYFARATSSPRIALSQGRQLYPAWLSKLDRAARYDGSDSQQQKRADQARGAASAFRQRIREIHDRLAAPEQTLHSSEDQSWFALGYFHQKAHDIRQARASHAPETPVDELSLPDSHESEGTTSDED